MMNAYKLSQIGEQEYHKQQQEENFDFTQRKHQGKWVDSFDWCM